MIGMHAPNDQPPGYPPTGESIHRLLRSGRSTGATTWYEAGDDSKTLMSDGDFVRGLAGGALDVWREVKDQL